MTLESYSWACPMCKDTLNAFSEGALASLKELHVAACVRKQDRASELVLTAVRVKDPQTGEWKWWNDRKWLQDQKIDPVGKDERSPSELARRYKPRGEAK